MRPWRVKADLPGEDTTHDAPIDQENVRVVTASQIPRTTTATAIYRKRVAVLTVTTPLLAPSASIATDGLTYIGSADGVAYATVLPRDNGGRPNARRRGT